MNDHRCDDCEELLIVQVDGELAPEETALLEAHLDGCAACRTRLEEYRALHAAAGAAFGVRREEVPPAGPFPRPAPRTVSPERCAPGADAGRPDPFRRFAPLALAAALLLAVGVARLLVPTGAGHPPDAASLGRETGPGLPEDPPGRTVSAIETVDGLEPNAPQPVIVPDAVERVGREDVAPATAVPAHPGDPSPPHEPSPAPAPRPAAAAPTGEVRLGSDEVDLDSMDERTRRLLFPGR